MDAVANAGTVPSAADQSGMLEDSQVLGGCRLGQRELADDLTAYTRLFARQHAENAHAGGVTDGLGELGEFLVGLGTFERADVGRGRVGFGTAEGLRFLDRHSSIDDSMMWGRGQDSRHEPGTYPAALTLDIWLKKPMAMAWLVTLLRLRSAAAGCFKPWFRVTCRRWMSILHLSRNRSLRKLLPWQASTPSAW